MEANKSLSLLRHWSLYRNCQIKLKIQAVSLFCAGIQLNIPSVLFRVYITYS